ncbi:MAG: hypothetical protein V2B18_20115 [Pseudomonadota bacterium]
MSRHDDGSLLQVSLEDEAIGAGGPASGIEELAQAQGVGPLKDVTVLLGTWPGELDDGFENEIRSLRNQGPAGGSRL